MGMQHKDTEFDKNKDEITPYNSLFKSLAHCCLFLLNDYVAKM